MGSNINEWYTKIVEKMWEESDGKLSFDEFSEKISKATISTLPRIGDILLDNLKQDLYEMINNQRLIKAEFEARLERKWMYPLSLLEMLLVITAELGTEVNNTLQSDIEEDVYYLFDALRKLHARASQISYEVLSLLKSGLADGAMARWRSLHEIAVVALFIIQNGNLVAKRFLDYQDIETYEEALVYQRYHQQLGYEPLDESDYYAVGQKRNDLIKEYGEEFVKPYGWAATILEKKDRTFTGLERYVELDHLRPYYKLACNNIHSGPKGMAFRLGLLESTTDEEYLLAGPSNYGLADPGNCTAISLTQITAALINIKPNIEQLAAVTALNKLVCEIQDAFINVQQSIEEEERELELDGF